MGHSLASFFRTAAVLEAVDAASSESAESAGEMILAEAQHTVPYETGELERSGRVDTDGDTAVVSYDTPYAVRLHENPGYNFKGSGRGKWLERTLQEKERDVLPAMAGPMRSVFRGGL